MTKMSIVDEGLTQQAKVGQWLGSAAGDRPRFQSRTEGLQTSWVQVSGSIPARYQVLGQVGAGGTGIVYKVQDFETGETLALKVLKPGIASDQDMQQSLRKEVCLARKVTHKNVCRIHEFNRLNDTACLSMEFVEGENLLSKLRRVGRLPLEESIQIARQICAGLGEAHAQGIIHRDLKPANIMLDPAGVVKIMDFGIARLSQGNGQLTGTIVGTPAYMAPEQVQLKPMGPRADIYALGLVLYEMVTGAPAFAGDTSIAIALKQIQETPKRPCEIVPGLPAHIEAVILKCLQKEPAERFQSVGDVSVALEEQPTKVQRVVDFSMEKARAVVPQLTALATDVQHGSSQATRFLGHALETARAFVRARDLRAAGTTRGASAVAVLAVALLGTTFAYSRVARERNRAAKPTTQVLMGQSLPSPLATGLKIAFPVDGSSTSVTGSGPVFNATPSNDSNQAVTTKEVDLSADSGAASGTESLLATASPDNLPSREFRAAEGVKETSNIETSTPVPSRTNPTQGRVRSSQPANARPTQRKVATSSVPREPAKAIDALKPSTAAADLPVTAPPAAAAPKDADTSDKQKADGSKVQATETYLEVGSFNDASWADKAVDQLSKLGFHAVSLHKTHLWMQSYHVLVGPYANGTETGAAQASLAELHFKSHVAK